MGHLYAARANKYGQRKTGEWLRELLALGLKPYVRVLCRPRTEATAAAAERKWIAKYSDSVTNAMAGGERLQRMADLAEYSERKSREYRLKFTPKEHKALLARAGAAAKTPAAYLLDLARKDIAS